jgi:hypothetical protein
MNEQVIEEIKRRPARPGTKFVDAWPYHNAEGAAIGAVARYDSEFSGAKTFLPFTLKDGQVSIEGFPKPRPLYNLHLLTKYPDRPVLVVEGEKAADAAGKLLPDYVVTTSAHGAQSVSQNDWSPLATRKVTIWPDADEPGKAYAKAVAECVPHALIVVVPADFPKAWDLADELPPGADIAELLNGALAPVNPKGAKAKTKAKPKAETPKLDPVEDPGAEAIKAAVAEAWAAEGSLLDGAIVLNRVRSYLLRFISYPTAHACTAHVLWIAHAHMLDVWDSTPRIGFMSPEPGSGKTRALEVTELLVPRPVHSVNNSVAYMIRKIADEEGQPTILYDEVDALFGTKAQAEKADLLTILNAGYRKGAVSGRCVADGRTIRTEELPAYCAVALAGLRNLPDTLASRTIFVEMRRRAPNETVEPFRGRIHRPQAQPIYNELRAWCASAARSISEKYRANEYPELPDEITDRAADCWEPLVSVADAAGGEWPKLVREAALYLVKRAADRAQTSGVELLADIKRVIFGDEEKVHTVTLLDRLCNLSESRWNDVDGRGHKLTDRGLADMLKDYGVRSHKQIKLNQVNRAGYVKAEFEDAWNRYLPTGSTRSTRSPEAENENDTNDLGGRPPWSTDGLPTKGQSEGRPGGRPEVDHEVYGQNLNSTNGLEGAVDQVDQVDHVESGFPHLPPFLDRRVGAVDGQAPGVCPCCDGEGCPWCQRGVRP